MSSPGPAALLFLCLLAALTGCGSSFRAGNFLPPVFRTSQASVPDDGRAFQPGRPGDPGVPGAAELVERSLRARGAKFGTDGSPRSLFAYVKYNHALIAPAKMRVGDVVFFDLGGRGCGDHVGLVEAIDDSGRVTFREARDGEVRRSYLHAGAPSLRRDESGRILNTFMRPKRRHDPDGAGYFAGEMLCAVGRVAKRR